MYENYMYIILYVHLLMNTCTKFQVAILENGWVLPLLKSKKTTLYTIYEDFDIFPFSIFVRFGRSKKFLGHFCVFDEILAHEHTSHHPNSII